MPNPANIFSNKMIKPRPKKGILLVGPVPPPYGGIALYVKRILESSLTNSFPLYLHNTAISPEVRAYDASTERGFRQAFRQKSVYRIFGHVFLDFLRFIKKLVHENIAAVHIHTCSFWGYYRSVVYLLIAKILGVKVILHLHNAIDTFYFEESGFLTRGVIKASLKLADVNVALSPKLAEIVRDIAGHEQNVDYIETGIPLDQFDGQMAMNSSTKNKTVHVLTIGKLSKNKGTFDILRAIPRIVEDYRNICIHFIGHGDRDRIRQYVDAPEILDYCDFTGPIDDEEKKHWLRNSDIFVLPSYAEGHPAVILEAMAVGLPVIATRVGAIPEVIVEGENGFTIEVGDVDALADRVIRLAGDRALREKMGKNNIRKVHEKYSIDTVFDKIGKIYSRIM
jgi:glycosyltransferase involved in cell wall biosynthesis